MRERFSLGLYSFFVLFLTSLFAIGNLIDRYQSFMLLLAFGSAFLAYFFLMKEKKKPWLLLGVGLLARVLLFISMPSLSDDIYRFIWDGTLLQNGIHPFEHLPAFYLDQGLEGINQKLYDRLNSPDYYTIYPPSNQFLFWLSVLISDGNWLVAATVLRVVFVLADVGAWWLLRKLLVMYGKSPHLAFGYFLNPLIILEFTGNVHFEGLVIFFLLAGIYFYKTHSKWLSASSLGLAVGVKLLPLIYLPYFFLKGWKEKKGWIALVAGVIGLLSIAPLFNEAFISGMQESLDLYFRKFEFNASLYFLAREIGYSWYGYNKIAQIGPLLSIFSAIVILALSVFSVIKKWSIPKTMLFILSAYLLFATTVHPWYILPLIVFGLLSGYYFPILWSCMIVITYLGYSGSGFELPLSYVGIEYGVVVVGAVVEIWLSKTRNNPET